MFSCSLIVGIALTVVFLLSITWLVKGHSEAAINRPLLVLEFMTATPSITQDVAVVQQPAPPVIPKPIAKRKDQTVVEKKAQLTEVIKPTPMAKPVVDEQPLQAAVMEPVVELEPQMEMIQPVVDAALSQKQEPLPTPVPIFQLTQMPSFLHRTQPVFPESMRADGVGAVVKLEALIDKEGKVRRVDVIKSAGVYFDQAAKSAILSSRFYPARVNNEAVAVVLRIPVKFELL